MYISKNLHVYFPQEKTVENSQISQYFAWKIEISTYTFVDIFEMMFTCAPLWKHLYYAPH